MKKIYVFNRAGDTMASAVFTNKPRALKYIKKLKLSGCLTVYHLNYSAYDWASEKGLTYDYGEDNARYIANFSHAAQEHYHF